MIDVNEYLANLEHHVKQKLVKLEQAVEREFKCKAYWDPIDQDYRFVNGDGRKHKHYTKS